MQNPMDKQELLHELRRYQTSMTDEAPYCVISRSLLSAAIENLESLIVNGRADPFMEDIRSKTTAREYGIIRYLDQYAGQIVPFADIMRDTGTGTRNALWAHTSRLRRKCKEYGWGKILHVSGGYIWRRADERNGEPIYQVRYR